MSTTKATSVTGPRFQTTVPLVVRKVLNLHQGSTIIWRVSDDGRVTIEPIQESGDDTDVTIR
jgi:bifunctional DNA-binding transcriptional regulator/antitoxin component of YhaV-PrlF toxin-antitoxin module